VFSRIQDFQTIWKNETEATLKLFRVLTDASLNQSVAPQDRNLGRIAWHIATTIPEMMTQTGLRFSELDPHASVPSSAAAIAEAYEKVASALGEKVTAEWTDATLSSTDTLYGETWARGFTLAVLIHHQIHHRGQMTVLMRQAGLRVPGIYGPAREEWAGYGMPEPVV
jgi:uncharacterized damage-inducible protein DinB